MGHGALGRRLGLVALAGTFAACASQTLPIGLDRPRGARGGQAEFSISQVEAFDRSLLESLPPSLGLEEAAERLETVPLGRISGSFQADVFSGQPGTFRGFAPGFTAELLSRARFLRAGKILIPYTYFDGRYVPLVFADRRAGLYFYPALIEEDGILIPVYHVVSTLLDPFTVAIPVSVPATYVSPIAIILVPAPIVIRPIIIRPRPRPRPSPRPSPEPTVRPTRPPTAEPSPAPTVRPTRPPIAEPSPVPTVRPTRPPTVRPTRPPRDQDGRIDRRRDRRPGPREIPEGTGMPELPGRPVQPGVGEPGVLPAQPGTIDRPEIPAEPGAVAEPGAILFGIRTRPVAPVRPGLPRDAGHDRN